MPQQFQQLLTHATTQLGSSGLMLPMLNVSAAAIGNGARLETDMFPYPVNPSLACAVIGSKGLEITEHLISPLREERDNCLLAVSPTRRKTLQDQIPSWQREQQIFFGKDLPRDPEDEAYFETKIRIMPSGQSDGKTSTK